MLYFLLPIEIAPGSAHPAEPGDLYRLVFSGNPTPDNKYLYNDKSFNDDPGWAGATTAPAGTMQLWEAFFEKSESIAA
ncbi:MAG: hypothetical protein R2792_20030 [Saprospiraceae bacterium]